MTNKIFAIIIIGIIFLAGIFFAGWFAKPSEVEYIQSIKTDTLYITIPAEPIVITKARPQRTIIKYDTIRTTDTVINFVERIKSISAMLDTIVKNDTVFMMYSYPENEFYLNIRRHPDTTIVIKERIIYKDNPNVPVCPSAFQQVLTHSACFLGGGVFGYLIGRIK